MRTLIAALAVTSTTLWAAQPSFGQEQEPGATVEVQNNFEDRVEVFVEAGQFDRRLRLGTVAPNSTETLDFPESLVATGDHGARRAKRHVRDGEPSASTAGR